MIDFFDVSYRYPSSQDMALERVSFRIPQGSLTILTGASGSGKSTVGKCINGLIPHLVEEGDLTGKVLLNTEKVRDLKIHQISKKVGSVFQDPRGQFFTTKVKSELAFTMENFGLDPQEMKIRMEEVCAMFSIEDLLERSLTTLSGGERQKVSLACALTMKPQVLLLDEPSANLDYASTLELRSLLQELHAKGYTIVVIEHRLFYLRGLADQILMLDQGKVEDPQKYPFSLRCWDVLDFVYENLWKEQGQEVFLQGEGLSFKHILQDIHITLRQGDITALVGKNGAGKTTLGKILAQVEKPCSGKVCTKERPLFIMQEVDYQLFGYSAQSELFLGNPHASMEEVERSLACVDLLEKKNVHPFALSGGQKQRLLMALAQVSKAKMVIFDEPTSGLDAQNMQRAGRLIQELAKTKAILVISHDVEFISKICNRVIYLEQGRIREEFPFQSGEESQLVSIFQRLGKEE